MSIRNYLNGLLFGVGATAAQLVSAVGLPDVVATQPVGTWQKVNQNQFQSVWAPAGQRPANLPTAKISAWASGGYDPVTGDFFVLGGDNMPYSGNEVYRFNGSTLLWQRDSLPSAIVAPVGDQKVYLTADGPDGSPMAGETYDNVVFLQNSRRLAYIGGNAWPGEGQQYYRGDGVTRTGPYFFDPLKADPNKVGGLPGSQWNAASYPNVQAGFMWENRQSVQTAAGLVGARNNNGGVTAVTQRNGKDVVYVGELASGLAGGLGRLFRYTVNSLAPGDDTWELVGVPVTQSYGGAGVGALDTERQAFARTASSSVVSYVPATNAFSGASKYQLLYWNLKTAGATNPSVFAPHIAGDPLPLASTAGLEYDPDIDAYLVWEGNKDVWLVYPPNQLSSDGWFARKVSPEGDGPTLGGFTYTGVYGKWNHMPGLAGLMGVIQPTTGDIWVYKPDPALANPKLPLTYVSGFRANANGGLEVYVADPAAPGTPRVIVPHVPVGTDAKSVLVPHAVTLAPRMASAMHNRSLVLPSGNVLVKVDLRQAGSQVPVQLSSESGAAQLCGFPAVAADYQDADRSAVVYGLPGPDGNCASTGDNEYRMVRVGMTPTDTPLVAKRPVTAVYDDSHAHIGWLATDGTNLVLTDANFQAPQVIGTFSGNADNVQSLGVDKANNVVLLKIDLELRAYNKQTNILAPSIHSFQDAARSVLFSQDDYLTYFVDRGASASTIRRVRSDGSSTVPLQIASETRPIITAPKLFHNSTRMAYLISSTTAGLATVRVADKTTGTIWSFASSVSADFLEVAYNVVYYNVPVGATGFKAGRIEGGGVNRVELANSRWAGALAPTTGDLGAGVRPVRLVRVDRVVSDRDAGGTVNVIDPTSNLVLAGQGALPTDSARFSVVQAPGGVSYAGAALGTSTSIAGGSQPTNFYFNSESAGTVTPLGQGVPVSGGNAAPIVSLFASPTAGFTSTDFTFSTAGSFDPDGTITSYEWNFGDSTFGSGASVNHTYLAGGNYTVQVTATDDKGAQSQASIVVNVQQVVELQINVVQVRLVGTLTDASVTSIKVNGQDVPVVNGAFDAPVTVGTGTTNVTLEANGQQGTVTKAVSVSIP